MAISMLPVDALLLIMLHLTPEEAYRILVSPLDKSFKKMSLESEDLWFGLCVAKPWEMDKCFCKNVSYKATFKDLLYQARSVHNGQIADVVTVLQIYKNCRGLQEMAIIRLARASRVEAHRTVIKLLRTDIQLASTMKKFQDDTKILSWCCQAMVTMCRPVGGIEGSTFHGLVDNEGWLSLMEHDGGIEMVLGAMRRHPLSEALQTNACWALVNLALVPAQKAKIVSGGGVELVLSAMQRHSDHVKLQFRAVLALINFVVPNDEEAIAPLQLSPDRIVPTVLATMRRHPCHEPLISRACLVLRNFSLKVPNHAAMKSAGAVEVLRSAARRFETVHFPIHDSSLSYDDDGGNSSRVDPDGGVWLVEMSCNDSSQLVSAPVSGTTKCWSAVPRIARSTLGRLA